MTTTPTPVTITPLRRAPIYANQIRQTLSGLIRELEHLQAQAEAIEAAIEPLLLEQEAVDQLIRKEGS